MSKYETIPTAIGQAKELNGVISGDRTALKWMAVGSGDADPDGDQTALQAEEARVQISRIAQSASDPNVIEVDAIFPTESGGYTIREGGVFDADGTLIYVARLPTTVKPSVSSGAASEQFVRMLIAPVSSANVTLLIDPHVVTASRQYVDERLQPTELIGSTALIRSLRNQIKFEIERPVPRLN